MISLQGSLHVISTNVIAVVAGAAMFGCAGLAFRQASDAALPLTRYCALTFDDGPDIVKTSRVLEKLENYGVPATFFSIGRLVTDRTKPVINRALKDGCEIGNHSWSWDSLTEVSSEKVSESVEKTSAVIEKYTGQRPRFFRPPNLAVNRIMTETIDMPFVSGVLGYDWDGCGTTAEQRAQNVLKGVDDGAIILLHDVQPDPHPTPQALDILIPELQKRAYTFLTLNQLFEKKGVTPQSHDGRLWVYVR
jgi:peptidoglycan/xylan/chitin deacetylase (PgdA/CDA1 family)